MKVKVVLSLIFSMLLLTSCFGKNDTDSSTEIDESQKEEESYSTSSTIGGGQGTPPEEIEVFKN